VNKTRQRILESASNPLKHIDTSGFTMRHFLELEKMEEEGLVRTSRLNSQRSELVTYFLNNNVEKD
jgi:hypothetical protein